MYKENKRHRYEVSHLTSDNVVDDRDEPETVDQLASFTDFFTVNEVMGNGDDFHYCIMCMKTGNPMRQLSISERVILLCDHYLYLSPGARRCITICCETLCQSIHESTRLSSGQVQRLISDLIMKRSRVKHTLLLAEDDPVHNDDDYTLWIGWTLDQLKSMTLFVASRMRYSKYCSPFEAVGLFWTKLKTNLSFRQIDTLFKIDTQGNSVRRRVEDTFHGVLACLNETLTSEYLDLTHLSRIQVLDHHTAYSRAFFGDQLSVIWNGTYIYCNKNDDHTLQRLTYSGQKSRYLIKMMSLVLPNGYILEFIGPFYGKDNDASISKIIGQDR